ncbi:MAG: hypothetical protein D6722_05410 [Bacteroidetes bacterium]|nr:MAG: hypothetical protein D6722_05410 [Bacteroidota bacterium]
MEDQPMNSTGNTPARADAPPLTTLSDLVFPGIRWEEPDYAHLVGRLDVYNDFIVFSRFRDGKPQEQYLVDPVEVAIALGGISLGSGLLPPNTLFWGRQNGYVRLGIYLPPRVWPLSIRAADVAADGRAWRVPLPGLLFVGHNYDYNLYAVADTPPLGPDTPLFVAPCPNIFPEGVCRGSAPFPPASPGTISQAVEAFFGSRFNHDLGRNKSKKHPERILDQWAELEQAGAEEYPLDDLVPTNLTLRKLADQ